MGLINCPECGKEISNKSETCIHCGYPLVNYICNINGIEYNLKDELSMALVNNNDWIKAIGNLRRKTSLTLSDGKELIEIMRNTKSVPKKYESKYPLEDRSKYEDKSSNTIKCPTCQSTNVKKIGTGERVASVAMMGVFSKKINKSFKCNSCGYTW